MCIRCDLRNKETLANTLSGASTEHYWVTYQWRGTQSEREAGETEREAGENYGQTLF